MKLTSVDRRLMKLVFRDGDYRIIENRDGGTPFTVWSGTTHLGDYHTLEGAKARCTRDKRSNAPKAQAQLDEWFQKRVD